MHLVQILKGGHSSVVFVQSNWFFASITKVFSMCIIMLRCTCKLFEFVFLISPSVSFLKCYFDLTVLWNSCQLMIILMVTFSMNSFVGTTEECLQWHWWICGFLSHKSQIDVYKIYTWCTSYIYLIWMVVFITWPGMMQITWPVFWYQTNNVVFIR